MSIDPVYPPLFSAKSIVSPVLFEELSHLSSADSTCFSPFSIILQNVSAFLFKEKSVSRQYEEKEGHESEPSSSHSHNVIVYKNG
ncbi:hypothetical protein HF330_13345 [Bacillus pumilus]|nr:hypothetical protein [Bacillus pumilus]